MSNTHAITRNIAQLYELAQTGVLVQRVNAIQYRLTLPGKGVWDYNPRRGTVKLVGTHLDIPAKDIGEWVRKKLAE